MKQAEGCNLLLLLLYRPIVLAALLLLAPLHPCRVAPNLNYRLPPITVIRLTLVDVELLFDPAEKLL